MFPVGVRTLPFSDHIHRHDVGQKVLPLEQGISRHLEEARRRMGFLF
jgi:hypothetical protein